MILSLIVFSASRLTAGEKLIKNTPLRSLTLLGLKVYPKKLTLRQWVRRAEIDTGRRAGVTSDERARIKELERENRELRRANEILRKASAYFAQAELDRRPKST